jgi:hypothetical protein
MQIKVLFGIATANADTNRDLPGYLLSYEK